MANGKTIQECMALLGGAFPETKVTPVMIQAYSRALSKIDDRVLVATTDYLIETERYFPRVVAVLEQSKKFNTYDIVAPDGPRWIVPDFAGYKPQQAPKGWKPDPEEVKRLDNLCREYGANVNNYPIESFAEVMGR